MQYLVAFNWDVLNSEYIIVAWFRKGALYMTSKQFDYNYRWTILLGIKSDKSTRAIAQSLECSLSSVFRELERIWILNEPSYYHNRMPECLHIKKSPWICTGWISFRSCKKLKYRYDPSTDKQTYEKSLHDPTDKSAPVLPDSHIYHIITPLIRDNGQSVARVFHSHSESLGILIFTLYRYIDNNRLTCARTLIFLPMSEIQSIRRSDVETTLSLPVRKTVKIVFILLFSHTWWRIQKCLS